MQPTQSLLAAAFAISVALHLPAAAQELGAPTEGEAPAIGAFPDAPEQEPEGEAPAADTPAPEAPAADVPAAEVAPEELPTELRQPEVVEIVRDTFQDWEVRCAPEGDECFLYQLAHDADGNPVAEFSLVRLANGSDAVAGVTVVTPLGTLLPAGLVLQIDTGEARQYEFTFCSQVGCFARFGLTEASVDQMRRGRSARMQLASIAAPDQPVTVDLSLMGFTAGYESLTPLE